MFTIQVKLFEPTSITWSTNVPHLTVFDFVGAVLKKYDPGAKDISVKGTPSPDIHDVYSASTKIGEIKTLTNAPRLAAPKNPKRTPRPRTPSTRTRPHKKKAA